MVSSSGFSTVFQRLATFTAVSLSILLAPVAHAQFKEIGPPPFSKAVAHQRMRGLLDRVEPGNRDQTIDQLNRLVPWFRDVLDDEMVSAWQRDNRDRLLLVMEPMADPHVASAVVAFSWHSRTDATLNPTYAPMLSHLMARYSDSGREFLSDLLAPDRPQLGPLQEETVCRILIDMPDIGSWSRSALQILPHYRATAERLLQQDSQASDSDKMYRARMWLAQLRGERTGAAEPPTPRRRTVISPAPGDTSGPILRPSPGAIPARPPAAPPAPPVQPADPPPPAATTIVPRVYNGPTSGTLECTGNPVPQNAEYVFRNLPPLKLQLDYDHKIWEARLTPAQDQSQRLILRNISSGPQKRCLVRWSVVP
jgi:hypothetical protein